MRLYTICVTHSHTYNYVCIYIWIIIWEKKTQQQNEVAVIVASMKLLS